ncbi:hypothetical protein [Lactococcus formosensis]|uniref:Uncharacterized protein n=1 Tax=Lactococcus formosensis TaxID=1281486 RepID=A0A9Q8Y0Q9_9LACT|nr:hypothetical protein [Lactococcus formosensis]USJ19905.1 hypothetical protein LMK00_08710 [Lactococcus formosensis]
MNQKEIKAIKKEVQEESAINVGYYTTIVGDIINKLGDYFLTSVLSELGEEIVEQVKDGQNAEAMNIFVTEAVRQMTYSEFKLIAHNFFSYRQENNEIISKAIEPTEDLHQNLAAEEVLEREKSTKKVSTKELVEWVNELEITDIEWDIDDPELRGLYAEEIPESKKKYESSTIGEALDGFDYGILTGLDYKDRFAADLDDEDYIEPWTAEEGHGHYHIFDVPDDFMVLLDLTEPVQPFYWGRDYKELLNEMNTLSPFGDLIGNRNPSEDGWDRDVDFEKLEEIIEERFRGTMQKGKEFKKNKKIFTPEEFEKIIKETPFYSSLEESEFSSLQYLSDEQLKEVLEYQERQLQDTCEGIDQAAYEIFEDGADISDIDDWVKDFKVGMSNLRKILSEQLIRSERKQEKNKQEKVEQNTTRSLKI